jgi:uncharacterized protein YodC (DUF2158 family)
MAAEGRGPPMHARIGMLRALNRHVERVFNPNALGEAQAEERRMTAVWIYVDTSKQVGDVDHLKVFTNAVAADNWFKDNDPEGVAFECEVLGGIKWKLGDVVRVKSGGPLMTVGSITKAGKVICEWVDAAGRPQRASLSPDALGGDASDASLSDFKKLIDPRDDDQVTAELSRPRSMVPRLAGTVILIILLIAATSAS